MQNAETIKNLQNLAEEIKDNSKTNLKETALEVMKLYASSPNAMPDSIATVYREVYCMLRYGITVDEYLETNTDQ